ncbi:MAG: glycosyltransferase family 4 protein [bacterium]
MKILTLTTLFPNPKQPHLGLFVRERVKAMSHLCELKVVAPIRWPSRWRMADGGFRIRNPKSEIQNPKLEVFHPSVFLWPGIGRSLHWVAYFLSVVRTISRLRQTFSFDLLDVHYAYPDGAAGVLLGKYLKVPVSITVRGTDINLFSRERLRGRVIQWALVEADLVIAVSVDLGRKVVDLGVSPEKVKIIPNGVDSEKFYPVNPAEARRQLGLSSESLVILSVANLIKTKGIHHIIEAVKEVREKGKEVNLIIVGEGQARPGLERQIRDLGLIDSVKLIGACEQTQLYLWYNAANLFCLASYREGCPNVLLEALACGCPVAAVEVGGVPEIITSEDYGLLVKSPPDRGSLSEAIWKALNKDWDREKLISYARERTWDKVAEQVMIEFNQIADCESRIANCELRI